MDKREKGVGEDESLQGGARQVGGRRDAPQLPDTLELGGGRLGPPEAACHDCALTVFHPGQPPVALPREWQWPWGVKATEVSLCPGNLHSPPSKTGSSRNTRYRV